jgi:hypothetical protein
MSQEMNMNEKKTTIKQFNADENQFKDPTYGTFDAKPATTTTITTTTITQPAHSAYHHSDAVLGKDSEVTDQNKPGVMEGAKQMVWQGVEKAKGMFSSNKPVTEQHPGKSYNWKKVTGEQGQTRWVATDDWSNDSARGTFWEKAKGVFTSNRDAKDSEFEQKQEFTADGHEQKGVLQGAKEKVWQGVEKAKGMFSTPIEQHPGKGYTWKKVQGEQGRFHWVATNDWSGTPSGQPATGVSGVFQGAKEKVWQGVEKAKEVFSTKSTDTHDPHPGKGYKWKKVEGQKGEEAHWKPKTFQGLTGTHS